MSNLSRIHRDMRPTPGEWEPVRMPSGTTLTRSFLVLGHVVWLAGWFRFVWAAMTGRQRGILILDQDDGIRRTPRVLLDWFTYSSLLLMAQPQKIPDLTTCDSDAIEMGAATQGVHK